MTTTARDAEQVAHDADRMLQNVRQRNLDLERRGQIVGLDVVAAYVVAEQIRALRLAVERIPYAKDTQL